MESLTNLIKKVDRLFVNANGATYSYSLNRFPSHWQFRVVNDWHNWLARELECDFIGNTPEEAIRHFLLYVEINNIDVGNLVNET